jgi:hypothetical protein
MVQILDCVNEYLSEQESSDSDNETDDHQGPDNKSGSSDNKITGMQL